MHETRLGHHHSEYGRSGNRDNNNYYTYYVPSAVVNAASLICPARQPYYFHFMEEKTEAQSS